MSQTLKALARKELIQEQRAETDRRWISYDVTKRGHEALAHVGVIANAVTGLSNDDLKTLERVLDGLLKTALNARNGRVFGICRTCRYHARNADGAYCELLQTTLTETDADKICHEYQEEPREAV